MDMVERVELATGRSRNRHCAVRLVYCTAGYEVAGSGTRYRGATYRVVWSGGPAASKSWRADRDGAHAAAMEFLRVTDRMGRPTHAGPGFEVGAWIAGVDDAARPYERADAAPRLVMGYDVRRRVLRTLRFGPDGTVQACDADAHAFKPVGPPAWTRD